MEKVKMVRVVATERGHDGIQVREPGEEFDMPENVLTHKIALTDEKGKPTGDYEVRKASWFKAKKESESLDDLT